MRKVIKILSKLILSAILLLIILPLALSVMLTISGVQNRIINYATTWATEVLDSRVEIKSIRIGALGKLRIGGFLVEDSQADTLLYAEQLDLQMLRLAIPSREIRFGDIELRGGQLNIREMKDSTLNIRAIVDKLTPKTPAKKKVKITFGEIKVSGFDFRFERLQHRNPSFGMDYADMELQNITTVVDNLTILGSNVLADIKSLSTTEKCGFEVVNMSAKFNLTSGCLNFDSAKIESRYSSIDMPHLAITGTSWADYRDFIHKVKIEAQVQRSTLMSDDIAYFAPRLRDWGITVTSLDAKASGTVDNLGATISHSQFEQGSALAVQFQIKGLPDIKKSRLKAQILDCMTIPSDIEKIYRSITDRELPPKSLSMIERMGELRYSGGFDGEIFDFVAHFDATSPLGVVRSNFTMTDRGEGGHILSGDVESVDFDLGELLENSNVGKISVKSKIEGDITNLKESSVAYGIVSNIELRGESYRNILYSGVSRRGEMRGEVRSVNKGLNFALEAELDTNHPQGRYDINLALNDIDLKRLRLNERDSISCLSAKVEAVGEGIDPNSMSANVVIQDGKYSYGENSIETDNITLHTRNSEGSKYFELTSAFADVTYSSMGSYQESWQFLKESLMDYLPALYKIPRGEEATTSRDEILNVQDNYSIISLEVKELHQLSDAFVKGLQVAQGSRVDLMYNSSLRDMSLSLRSQYIEMNSVLALDINLDASNSADSLALYGSVKELLVGTRQLNDVSLNGGANDNSIHLTAGYNNDDDESTAEVEAVAYLQYTHDAGRSAAVHLLPSQITQGTQRWDIIAHKIDITPRGIAIDNFKIRNSEQELLINGLASRSESDTLRVSMHNFDLSILSSVTKAIGYSVEGFTSGEVTASSALYDMKVEANITVDSVSVNRIPAPPMRLLAEWDARLNRAEISLKNRIKQDTLIRGYFIPSEAKYHAQVDIDSLNLALLDAPLKGILTDTKGYVNARLSIDGVRRNASLGGEAEIYDMQTRVGYTNVTYRVPRAKVAVINNELIAKDVTMYDPLRNSGLFDLSVSLQHLSNIAYRVRLRVNDILALNTTAKDNDLFYGEVFASGVVEINGDKSGVNMDIVATTEDKTAFYMPLSSKSSISTAEFIKFVAPLPDIDTTDMLLRKRLSFEAQRRRRARGGDSNLNINMALSVTPQAAFQLVIDPTVGDVIRGRGEGQINLRVNPKSNIFDMYGDYTITEGSYLFTLRNIINKRFVINPGSTIQWSGDPLDANMNIEAVYKLKTSLQPLMSDESTRAVPVDCTIILSGKLMKPDVTFDISLPTADPEQEAVISNLLNDQEAISRQFFYLMLANSFISEAASGAGSEFGVSTTAATGFELLTNQLSNWLSTSNYNVVIRYRPESDLAGDEVDLGISRSLINNRLLLEVEGNYTNDTSTVGDGEDATSNFAGEAYITWLIDRSGALRLRGFTQTIDRFDENQGLQETGIGIYYKESFNDFKDLQQRVKARFSRKGVAINDEKRRESNKKTDKKQIKEND